MAATHHPHIAIAVLRTASSIRRAQAGEWSLDFRGAERLHREDVHGESALDARSLQGAPLRPEGRVIEPEAVERTIEGCVLPRRAPGLRAARSSGQG